ncbi:MAG TPA: thioredoxin [Hyphomicrobiales bacterium]|nr:thioredoxin [Hyphomicrobiales bacterium]
MLLSRSTAAATTDAAVKETTTQTFVADVLEESKKQPVLVDFWAPWCGPCRQLAPVLEKVVRESKGKVKLVKMNIDDHPAVANQLRIQSIPAVIAFAAGQAVDGFMGAIPESQVKAFVDRVGAGAPPPPGSEAEDVGALLDAGDEALQAGDAAGAAELFAAVLAGDPAEARAIAGLARAQAAAGDLAGARRTLSAAPDDKKKDAAIAAAEAQITLAERTAAAGDAGDLAAKVASNAADHQARFDLALAQIGRGQREEGLDNLLEIVRRDRAWNEDGARKQIVQLFEAWGPTDPLTVAGRRRLSSLLFS